MIIFDEKRYAEQMIKKGFKTKKRQVYELHILAKYFKDIGYEDEKIKDELEKFCIKHIEHFNMDEWYKILNKTVSIVKKAKFITGVTVGITQKELDTITQLENIREQKVAFVMLVLYKFHNYKKFEISIEDLYRLVKLTTINSKTKLQILQSLTSQALIDINMGSKRWVKFADKKGKTVIEISNFDDFIYEYELYIGNEGFANCEECNIAIKVTNNRKKYCKCCWKEKQKEWQRESMRKLRNKNNVKF